jgi:hypothetical protein
MTELSCQAAWDFLEEKTFFGTSLRESPVIANRTNKFFFG